ncbi:MULTISPECIES: recombinase family protein [Chryseobacterium]|uniref:recombinase family protein n=1 Tax=Chryseobacterium TaxID=59732 RepID=UPI00286BDB68|nr:MULTISPECIES: recombinase family protein [Chryseobacterium]
MKKAIRYLRFSKQGQSVCSIERQEMITDNWLKFNGVELIDSFVDQGKSARTFDRPDFIKLKEFIVRHHKKVDYLVVDQLDRFSRIADEAITMVKGLQKTYGIQIVSVTENITFDYDTPGSYFRAGLQLLLAEEENINRSVKVRGGIYTAKTIKGRYTYKNPPFGYRKEGLEKARILVVDESQAKIVRFIYDSFLRNTPIYLIRKQAEELGFTIKGNMAIERVLKNPAYTGLIKANSHQGAPGGLFPGIHEPIIDRTTWQMVQEKIKRPGKTRTVIDDEIPLRGVLKCHCGNPLSGAPSRGKSGRYYHYYKCKHSKHNNISAIKAHEQFSKICELMSLPTARVRKIRTESRESIDRELEFNLKKVGEKKKQLQENEEKLYSLEEKWIKNEINKDTYDRWYSIYNAEIISLKGAIERLSENRSLAFGILENKLDLLTDLRYVYDAAETLQKREFVSLVFDNNLYYENQIFRTPTMMEILSHNHLKMRDKGLLIYDKKEDLLLKDPLSGE